MKPETFNIMNTYFKALGISEGFNSTDPAHMVLFRRHTRDLAELLKMGNADTIQKKIQEVSSWAKIKGLDWNLSTVIKRYLSDNSVTSKLVYTSDTWKDAVEPPRNQSRISAGLDSIKKILSGKGVRHD